MVLMIVVLFLAMLPQFLLTGYVVSLIASFYMPELHITFAEGVGAAMIVSILSPPPGQVAVTIGNVISITAARMLGTLFVLLAALVLYGTVT